MPERGADPAGHRLRGSHRRDHPHRHPGPLLGLLENGGGHREHSGIPGRHHRHRPPLLGQLAGQPGPLGLGGVVTGMAALTRAGRHPVQVGAVADQVGGGGQFAAALRRHPVGTARSETDHRDSPGPGERFHRPARSGQDRQREVRDSRAVDLRRGKHHLGVGAGPFDVHGVLEASGGRKRLAHLRIRSAQLHYHRGVCVGEAAGEFADGQRAGKHTEHLLAGHQRGGDRRGGRADRCHPRHDHGAEAVRQSAVHMHVGAVEERIPLGQQGDVAARGEVRGDPVGGLPVEVLHRPRVAAGMIGGLRGHRVDQVFLDLARAQVGLGDAAGDAASVASAVVGHHGRLADHPGGLDRHQLRVARPQSHAEQGSRHSGAPAIALTAAAAMALPPRRPITTR